ncbi:MAG: riboflavin synthase [Actinomycetota bacterium]
MFTGIVEEVGIVQSLRAVEEGARIRISSRYVWQELAIGDSICVNGVCLTVVELGGGFTADISHESLERSTLGAVGRGSPVNLERALALDSRLGGHIVQGHVDGVGKTVEVKGKGKSRIYTFGCPSGIEDYLVEKGSIAVDGVSLTISSLGKGTFSTAVIPRTLEETNLESLRAGDEVNLEVDIIAKYVMRFMERGIPGASGGGGGKETLYEKMIEGGFM